MIHHLLDLFFASSYGDVGTAWTTMPPPHHHHCGSAAAAPLPSASFACFVPWRASLLSRCALSLLLLAWWSFRLVITMLRCSDE